MPTLNWIDSQLLGQASWFDPRTYVLLAVILVTLVSLAAAAGITDLKFTYVGRTDLAKKYGALGLFHVDRA